MISSFFSSAEVHLLTTKPGYEPIRKEFPSKADSNVKFTVYTDPRDVEGSEFHQSIRKSSKVLLTLGVILSLALAGLYFVPAISISLPLWGIATLVVTAAFLVIVGVGVLIASFMGTRGSEVCKFTFSDIRKICNPPPHQASLYQEKYVSDEDVIYIPIEEYKDFKDRLDLCNKANGTSS